MQGYTNCFKIIYAYSLTAKFSKPFQRHTTNDEKLEWKNVLPVMRKKLLASLEKYHADSFLLNVT